MVEIEKELPLLFKTGKVVYGFREVMKTIYAKKVLGLIIARDMPKNLYDKLIYYVKIFSIPYYIYEGSSKELGVLCGKKFVISSIAILSPGESSILNLFEVSK
jgi:large subunit ribosomal protein L30e